MSLATRLGGVVGIARYDGDGFDPEATFGDGRHSGIGLRSMRERAQMLGGELNLTSNPGDGATGRRWRYGCRWPDDGPSRDSCTESCPD